MAAVGMAGVAPAQLAGRAQFASPAKLSRPSACSARLPARRPLAVSANAAVAVAEKADKAGAAAAQQRIRIRLRGYHAEALETSCDRIIAAAKETGAVVAGPVPLPTRRKIYCVLRAPHGDKDSREHFETRTHHRLIDLKNPSAQTIDALMAMDLPAGINIEVKLR